MNIALKDEATFDAEAQRRILKNAIAIKLAAARDCDQITITIHDAETRVAAMREELNEFKMVLNSVADFASEALKNNTELSPPADLLEAKKNHEHLLGQITFAESGLVSLKSQLEQKKRDLAVLEARTIEALEPIVIAEAEEMAEDLILLEHRSAVARAKLRAFALSGTNGRVQKLGPLAYKTLKGPPENSVAPMSNTRLWRFEQEAKRVIAAWRASLQADANARLTIEQE